MAPAVKHWSAVHWHPASGWPSSAHILVNMYFFDHFKLPCKATSCHLLGAQSSETYRTWLCRLRRKSARLVPWTGDHQDRLHTPSWPRRWAAFRSRTESLISGVFWVLELEVFRRFQHNPSLGFFLLFSRSVMSDSLRPHGLQHARLSCPSPTPGVYPNSCPLSWWWHPTISSSVIPFSSCLQSFPASGSFPMSQLFASSGQSIGASASASVLPVTIQDWVPSGSYIIIRNSMHSHRLRTWDQDWRCFCLIALDAHLLQGNQTNVRGTS